MSSDSTIVFKLCWGSVIFLERDGRGEEHSVEKSVSPLVAFETLLFQALIEVR